MLDLRTHFCIFLIIFVFFIPQLSIAQNKPNYRKIYTPHGNLLIVNNKEINVTAGNPDNLYGILGVKIIYDYSAMGIGEFQTAKDHFNDRRKYFTVKESEAYENEWKTAPSNIFEPAFEFYFNRSLSEIGVYGDATLDSTDVTLYVNVLHAQPEATLGETQLLPYLTLSCTFFHKMKGTLVTYNLTAFASKGKDFKQRLRECYAVAGKMLSKNVKNTLLSH